MAKEYRKRTELEADEVKGFKLLVKKNAYSVVQITAKRSVILDHRLASEQSLLKEIYDAGPQYRKWILAPKGYKAPWQP